MTRQNLLMRINSSVTTCLATIIIATLAVPVLPVHGNRQLAVGSAAIFQQEVSLLQQPLPPPGTAGIQAEYGDLPLSFEVNQGQTDAQVKFLSRGNGYNLYLTATEAVLTLRQGAETQPEDLTALAQASDDLKAAQLFEGAVLRMQLLRANPASQVIGLQELPGKVNYFLGNNPKAWRTGIPTFAKVAYRNVYPGVSLVYYGNQGQLEYDFVVSPGADPDRITLGFVGAESLALDDQGDLILNVAGGEIRQPRPLVYQEINGMRRESTGRYTLNGQDQVSIEVGAYDTRRPLVIDPMLIYSTYLGVSGDDRPYGITVDSSGNAYVTGETYSANFPTTSGAFDTSLNGGSDVFITKLNPAGSALVYSTFLGGNGIEGGYRIVVDNDGNAYVIGSTGSMNFPTTSGAFDTSHSSDYDIFVTKLNPSGSNLSYSTFLGGNAREDGRGIALDTANNAYVTGVTISSDFPTTVGAFNTSSNGDWDAFVAKLDPTGSSLVYSTYLGGSASDQGSGVAVNDAGNAYVTGLTGSSDFPITLGAFSTTYNGGSNDAFVTRLNLAGSALDYSTFLGGGDVDVGYKIALNSAGSAYLTGDTYSSDFPTSVGAFDSSYNGDVDPFVAKLDPTLSTLVYSTFLGGSDYDEGYSLALDSAGNAYVTGVTRSSDFPTTPGAVDSTFNGGQDIYLTVLNQAGAFPPGSSTFLGGSGTEVGYDIAVDNAGNAYLTGLTNSSDFPTTIDAYDRSFNGFFDAYMTKMLINRPPVAVDDSYDATANTVLSISAPGVLSNDTDADNDPLTAIQADSTLHGVLALNADGSFIYTPSGGWVGTDSFTYTANDGLVDSNLASVSIIVKYPFTGFFSPVDNPPVYNLVNAGQGIPIKFSLGGNYGLAIIASVYPTSRRLACTAGASTDILEETTSSNSGLNYDASTGLYIYVWKSQKGWADTCREFTLRLIDGSDHTALFRFK